MSPRADGVTSSIGSGHLEVDEREPPALKGEKGREMQGTSGKRGGEQAGLHRVGKVGSNSEGSKGGSSDGGGDEAWKQDEKRGHKAEGFARPTETTLGCLSHKEQSPICNRRNSQRAVGRNAWKRLQASTGIWGNPERRSIKPSLYSSNYNVEKSTTPFHCLRFNKVDPATCEVFAFRYGPIPPFLTYFRIGVDGKKQLDVPIFSLRQPSFVHDLAITERYAIFSDTQIVMKPLAIFTGLGVPLKYDVAKVTRVGIISRYATYESEMKWVEVPGFNFVHSVNAWDEKGGEEVVLVAANIVPVDYLLEMRRDLLHCCVEMVRINVREGKLVGRKPLTARSLEFEVINPKFLGRKNRYTFMAKGDSNGKFSGIVKLDFVQAGGNDCAVAARSFGERCFAGEPFFVGKEEDGDEDDSYVLTYTHDEGSGESRFVVMDAKSPTLDIVASVKLPQRVPYGFHGLFVSEKDLRKQKNWK
ncbi:9-cis-epoxycarotenoid dioxygenase NCED1, chloroplastic-like [Nymphaea colorata]|nr:9-cis-epoxycarotenoid dioxygenase NCED1, chloroplastic-like [Nymphaea colorata]